MNHPFITSNSSAPLLMPSSSGAAAVSCVRPLAASLLLKRVSPAVAATAADSSVCLLDASALKVAKRQFGSSPRADAVGSDARGVVSVLTSNQRPSLCPLTFATKQQQQTTPMATLKKKKTSGRKLPSWPVVKSCDNVRNAITFLQTSRQHAMALMLQNHWDRAVGVLEKIEKATESVCQQRRKVVIQQANAQLGLAAQIDDLGLSDDELAAITQSASASASAAAATPIEQPRRRHCVRFSEHVSVAVADEMDRSSPELPPAAREEVFVLRASRSIPQENLSEFW